MTVSQSVACHRLRALGVNQENTHRILDLVNTWITNSGPEWTVTRLKEYKQLYLQQMAGSTYHPKAWISMHKDGTPKGALGSLWKGTSDRHRARALNALMIYSTQVSATLTEKQLSKFMDSATKPVKAVVAETVDSLTKSQLFHEFVACVRKGQTSRIPAPLELRGYPLSPNRRAPMSKGTVPESDLKAWFADSADCGLIRQTVIKHPELFGPETLSLVHKRVKAMPNWDSSFSRSAGRIGFIQEPGFKLRAVANPNRLVQLLLEPLKTVLLRSLKENIPQDCTHDQSNGVRECQRWLQEGKVVHSIDLSDATNNFPLSLQMRILRSALGDKLTPHLDVFEKASRMPWIVPGKHNTQMTWSVGQPLGLGPSFPAFALAHHFIVQSAFKLAGVKEVNRMDYRILGDDVVIAHDRAASVYRTLLKGLDCPVSESKTISSDRVAEFGGRVITPSSVIQTSKWRGLSDRNFLDLVKQVGIQFLGSLPTRQKRVARMLLEIPEEYGGLGFNPKGKSYSQRVTEGLSTIRLLSDDTKHSSPHTRANSCIDVMLIEQGLTRSFSLLDYFLSEKGVSARDHVPADQAGYPSVRHRILSSIKPLDEKFHDDERVPDGYYPTVREGDPRGPTRLDNLERKLGIVDKPKPKGFSF